MTGGESTDGAGGEPATGTGEESTAANGGESAGSGPAAGSPDSSSPADEDDSAQPTVAADELKRRLVHASGSGLVALWLLAQYLELPLTWTRFRLLMVGLLVGVVALEVLRLRVGLDWWIYEKLTREYEADQFAGYGYYMVSMTTVVVLFQPAIALPAMLMVAIGDPISGALSDDTLRRVKRPHVLAATFGVMLVLALPFLNESPAAAVAAAIGGTLADGVTVTYGDFVLDDNLTIPIYAGVAAWLVLELVPA